MEPKGSLRHSQMPATCSYPEPSRSSPYPHIPLLKIHLNSIPPSTPVPSKWSLSFSFPHQIPVCNSPLSHTCYMPRPSHSSRFDNPTILGDRYRSLSSSLYSFLHFPLTSFFLGPNIFLYTLFSNTLSLRSSLNVSDHVLHPYKTTAKIIFLYILIFDSVHYNSVNY